MEWKIILPLLGNGMLNCLPWHQLFGEAELRRLRAGRRTSPYLQFFTTLSNAVSRKTIFQKHCVWHFLFYPCLVHVINKIALILVVSKGFIWYEHNWYLEKGIYMLPKFTKNTPYSITTCGFNIDVKWRTALSWIHGVTDQDKSLWSEIMCR